MKAGVRTESARPAGADGEGSPDAQPSLAEIAQTVESQAWNAPRTDKTWVLRTHEAHEAFLREVQASTRVRDA